MTLIMSFLFMGTFYLFTTHAVQEIINLIDYLQLIATKGIDAPEYLKQIPIFGRGIYHWWSVNLQMRGAGIRYIQQVLGSESTGLLSYAQSIGSIVMRIGSIFSFSMIVLFCIYYSGVNWSVQVTERGIKYFGSYWNRYISPIPVYIRAIGNGLFLVALIEALGMGISYYIVGLPSVILMGAITGILSIVPLVSPLFVLMILFYLWAIGNISGLIIVFIAGILFLGVFDNWARPVLIGQSIKLPFLPVFFGILGGIETMGLLGLFIGPIVMVSILKIWQDLMIDRG